MNFVYRSVKRTTYVRHPGFVLLACGGLLASSRVAFVQDIFYNSSAVVSRGAFLQHYYSKLEVAKMLFGIIYYPTAQALNGKEQ